MLTPQDIEDVRALVCDGYRTQTVAELFGVSQRRVQQLVEAPPTPEELCEARERLELLRQTRDASVPHVCGYSGDKAVLLSEVFSIPADGGTYFDDGDGLGRF